MIANNGKQGHKGCTTISDDEDQLSPAESFKQPQLSSVDFNPGKIKCCQTLHWISFHFTLRFLGDDGTVLKKSKHKLIIAT